MITHHSRTAERGSAMVFVLVSVVLMMALGGLAVDLGRVYSDRREMQAVADAAVTAGVNEVLAQHQTDPARMQQKFIDTAKLYVTHDGDAGVTVCESSCNGHPPSAYVAPGTDPRYPNGAFHLSLTKTVPVTLLKVMGTLGRITGAGDSYTWVNGGLPVEVHATASWARHGLGIITLSQTKCASFKMNRKASLHLDSSMLFVNSSCDGASKAMNLSGSAALRLSSPAVLVDGGTGNDKLHLDAHATLEFAYTNSGAQYDQGATSVSTYSTSDGGMHLGQIRSTAYEPLGYLAGTDYQVRGELAPSNQRSVPFVQFGKFGTLRVQCGNPNSGVDDRKLHVWEGVPSQTNCQDALGKPTLCMNDPNFTAAHPGMQMGNCTHRDASGEFILCPGVYFGGLRIRSRNGELPSKVRLAKCDDPECQDPKFACTGTSKEPIFATAGGAITVRYQSPISVSASSGSWLHGDGVTLFQGKGPKSLYGRLQFDQSSDVDIAPPKSGPFQGVVIVMDPDYKGQASISARALSGIHGDIYGRQTRMFVGGPKRQFTGCKNGQQPCALDRIPVSFVVGTLRFGGNIQDEAGDTTVDGGDTEDSDTDSSFAEDPSIALSPDGDGNSGLQVTLGD